jgi:type II secretory pathway component PulF
MTTIGQARQAVAAAAARAELYRLWHAGQRMGAAHPHILEMMGVLGRAPVVEELRSRLLEGTRQRRTITSVLTQNPQLTAPFERAILIFGEESGTFEQSLSSLIGHFKAEHRLLRKIWSKLTYPMITSLAAIFIAPLPLLFMNRGSAYWLIVIAGLLIWYVFGGAVITGLAAKYASHRDFVLARLARALATGVEAGLPLDRVVTLAVQATSHPAISAHVGRIPVPQLATRSLSETFEGCSVIPVELNAALRVAEASGDFSGALRKLADLYDPDRAR